MTTENTSVNLIKNWHIWTNHTQH